MTMTIARSLPRPGTSVLAAVLVLAVPAVASAQMPTVDPGGTIEVAPAAEPVVTSSSTAGSADTAAEDTGYYHSDDYDEGDGPTTVSHNAPVPAVHVVRRGDTLWDISWFYFSSPWEWPRIWSYNPEISNPHWIYPGDQVRLRTGDGEPVAAAPTGDTGTGEPAAVPQPRRQSGAFGLRQLAYVDRDDLDVAGHIDGSPEEKVMLARGDEVYLTYPDGNPPKVGSRYSIYERTKEVSNPDTGKRVGAYVRILGELEVVSVKKDRRARAVILDSVDVIERGARVGPLETTFKNVSTVPAEADVFATIVAQLGSDQLIGARQVVFIDKGKADGLKAGNRMYVVRRGDAYEEVMGPRSNVGKDDRRFPARAVGEILVVQTGEHASVAAVTLSIQELGPGDHAVMSRAAGK